MNGLTATFEGNPGEICILYGNKAVVGGFVNRRNQNRVLLTHQNPIFEGHTENYKDKTGVLRIGSGRAGDRWYHLKDFDNAEVLKSRSFDFSEVEGSLCQKLDVNIGDLVTMRSIEEYEGRTRMEAEFIYVSGFINQMSSDTVEISHEHPFLKYRSAGMKLVRSLTNYGLTPKHFWNNFSKGDKTFDLTLFNAYSVVKTNKEILEIKKLIGGSLDQNLIRG